MGYNQGVKEKTKGKVIKMKNTIKKTAMNFVGAACFIAMGWIGMMIANGIYVLVNN